MTDAKDLVIFGAGVAGSKLVTEVTDKLTGSVAGMPMSRVANLLVGAGLSGVGVVRVPVPEELQDVAAVSGANLLVTEVFHMLGLNPGSPEVYVDSSYETVGAPTEAAPELVKLD